MSQLSGAQRSRLASEVHGLKDQLLGLQSHDGTMTVSGLGSVDYGDPLAMHNSTVANHKAMKVLQVSHQRGILGLAGRALERSVGSAPSGPSAVRHHPHRAILLFVPSPFTALRCKCSTCVAC